IHYHASVSSFLSRWRLLMHLRPFPTRRSSDLDARAGFKRPGSAFSYPEAAWRIWRDGREVEELENCERGTRSQRCISTNRVGGRSEERRVGKGCRSSE